MLILKRVRSSGIRAVLGRAAPVEGRVWGDRTPTHPTAPTAPHTPVPHPAAPATPPHCPHATGAAWSQLKAWSKNALWSTSSHVSCQRRRTKHEDEDAKHAHISLSKADARGAGGARVV